MSNNVIALPFFKNVFKNAEVNGDAEVFDFKTGSKISDNRVRYINNLMRLEYEISMMDEMHNVIDDDDPLD